MKKILLIILVFSLFIPICASAQETSKFSARVFVTVRADKTIKEKVEKLAKKELRALGDVVIINEDDEEYEDVYLIIAAKGVNLQAGKPLGYVFSFIAAVPFNYEKNLLPLLEKWESKIDVFEEDDLILATEQFYAFLDYQVLYNTSLEAGCKAIVAKFDTGTLEPERNTQ